MTSADVLASLPPLHVTGRVDKLRSAMVERDLDVGFVECFDKCDTCERRLIARIDGASVAVRTADDLLEMVDRLLEDR